MHERFNGDNWPVTQERPLRACDDLRLGALDVPMRKRERMVKKQVVDCEHVKRTLVSRGLIAAVRRPQCGRSDLSSNTCLLVREINDRTQGGSGLAKPTLYHADIR